MNLVINSQFRPFTYDEMVKPLAQYKEVYDKMEQDYSDIAAQTEMWKDMVNRTNSPEAYEMYQRYSNDLASVTDSFSRGLNMSNRRALMGMKRRYAQDITPIARASEAMKEANDFRAKASPDAIFEVGEYNSLDQFLHGKTANNRYQSREALTKKTAAMTEAAMAEAMKDPEFQKAMGDQFWMITQHTGGSYDELREAMKLGMMDNPIAQNRFSQIRQEVARKAGIDRYDSTGQQAIMEAIDLGLYAGLDKPTTQFQANQGYLNPLQQEQLRQMRMAGSGGGSGKGSKSKKEKEEEEKDPGAYVANNVIYEINEDDTAGVVQDMDPSKAHGGRVSWDSLPNWKKSKKIREVIENHIENSDPSQYEFYIWRPSANPNKLRVQIVRKQAYTKAGPSNPSLKSDPSDDYLNDN